MLRGIGIAALLIVAAFAIVFCIALWDRRPY
jgi:hypothetical protein